MKLPWTWCLRLSPLIALWLIWLKVYHPFKTEISPETASVAAKALLETRLNANSNVHWKIKDIERVPATYTFTFQVRNSNGPPLFVAVQFEEVGGRWVLIKRP